MSNSENRRRNDSFNKGAQGIDDGTLDAYVGKSALENSLQKPKAPPVYGKGISLAAMLIIAGVAWLGYQYGAMTAAFEGSDRPVFFAMVGGYVGVLLLAWRSSNIFVVAILMGMIEAMGQVALGISPHQYILNSF